MRLRFWLAVVDALSALHAPYAVWLWAVCRASAADDWTDGRAANGMPVPWGES